MDAVRSHLAQTTTPPILFTAMDIRPITAEQTRPLRQAVLRPHQQARELVYHGDDAPDTLHVGAFSGDQLVGVASVYREGDPGAWRLRGMAVTPALQRTGIGTALLDACIAHVKSHGGTRMWFNARTSAVAFYRRYGFQIQGEEFVLPDIGPHYIMGRSIE